MQCALNNLTRPFLPSLLVLERCSSRGVPRSPALSRPVLLAGTSRARLRSAILQCPSSCSPILVQCRAFHASRSTRAAGQNSVSEKDARNAYGFFGVSTKDIVSRQTLLDARYSKLKSKEVLNGFIGGEKGPALEANLLWDDVIQPLLRSPAAYSAGPISELHLPPLDDLYRPVPPLRPAAPTARPAQQQRPLKRSQDSPAVPKAKAGAGTSRAAPKQHTPNDQPYRPIKVTESPKHHFVPIGRTGTVAMEPTKAQLAARQEEEAGPIPPGSRVMYGAKRGYLLSSQICYDFVVGIFRWFCNNVLPQQVFIQLTQPSMGSILTLGAVKLTADHLFDVILLYGAYKLVKSLYSAGVVIVAAAVS